MSWRTFLMKFSCFMSEDGGCRFWEKGGMRMLKEQYRDVTQRLLEVGLRPTRQRLLLGHLLLSGDCRHVTAEALHRESKAANANISLATIYNTLHQFTECGLLKEVVVDGGRAYFDSNTAQHHHFYVPETGQLMDVPHEMVQILGLPEAPPGMEVERVDIMIRLKPMAA